VTESDLEDKFEVLVRYGTQLTELCQDAASPVSHTKLQRDKQEEQTEEEEEEVKAKGKEEE